MLGAELLVEVWVRNGIRVVFGMPGSVTLPLYDALYECKQIRHVLVRHEHAAAFMAGAYGRVTGKPGTVFVVPGPGATNASTGVADAFIGSVPMLLVTGDIDTESVGKGAVHEMDLDSFLAPITKARFHVRLPGEIPRVVSEAYRLAQEGRPGPVHISVPSDVLSQDVTGSFPGQPSLKTREEPLRPEDVLEVVDLLCSSHRPIILVGEGLVPRLVQEELVQLTDILEIPVLTSRLAKGSLPEDHPLALGVTRNDPVLVDLVGQSDLALALGYRFSETASLKWSLNFPQGIIQVDSDPYEIGKNYPVTTGFVCDEAFFLHELLAAVKRNRNSQTAERKDWRRIVENSNTLMKARLRPMMESEKKPIHPMRLIQTMRDFLDRDAVVTTDPGSTQIWALYFFKAYLSGTFVTSSEFASMGCGLPFAIAAKIAKPDRQVLCITGDGGFLMNCQELATAVEEELSIVIAIFNDGGFGAIRHAQDLWFSGRRIAVDWRSPDFTELAQSFGANGQLVTEPDEIRPSLEGAFESRLPYVLDFRIDPDADVIEALGRPL